MTYFDCFVVGSWMFAIGWFLGAIYVQTTMKKRKARVRAKYRTVVRNVKHGGFKSQPAPVLIE